MIFNLVHSLRDSHLYKYEFLKESFSVYIYWLKDIFLTFVMEFNLVHPLRDTHLFQSIKYGIHSNNTLFQFIRNWIQLNDVINCVI